MLGRVWKKMKRRCGMTLKPWSSKVIVVVAVLLVLVGVVDYEMRRRARQPRGGKQQAPAGADKKTRLGKGANGLKDDGQVELVAKKPINRHVENPMQREKMENPMQRKKMENPMQRKKMENPMQRKNEGRSKKEEDIDTKDKGHGVQVNKGEQKTKTGNTTSQILKKSISDHVHLKTNTIVLSFGDSSNVDFAVNLYATSLKRFGIKEHLFVGSDYPFCDVMRRHGARCVHYERLLDAEEAAVIKERRAFAPTLVEMRMVGEVVGLGVNVLRVGLDTVFLKNPLWSVSCRGCDLAIQTDAFQDDRDTGFYKAVGTERTRRFLDRAWVLLRQARAEEERKEAGLLHGLMKTMDKDKELSVVTLEPGLYPGGRAFFERGARTFRGDYPCRNCVIVYNSGLASAAARRYRLKEYGLWAVDDDRYYSAADRRYLAYDNPWTFRTSAETRSQERRALRSAFVVGRLLNRTVIVPRFHGGRRWTSLLDVVSVPRLDAQLAGAYREHVFLERPLVPAATNRSTTARYLLRPRGFDYKTTGGVVLMTVSALTVQPAEIRTLFGQTKALVLRFHSLYVRINEEKLPKELSEKLDRALRGP